MLYSWNAVAEGSTTKNDRLAELTVAAEGMLERSHRYREPWGVLVSGETWIVREPP
jgi:hypothetical protein